MSKTTLTISFIILLILGCFLNSDFILRLKIKIYREFETSYSLENIDEFPVSAFNNAGYEKESKGIEDSANQRIVSLPNNFNDWQLVEKKQILEKSEEWETPRGLARDLSTDSLGYPTVVKNIYGKNADQKFYLFYAHHDPTSGIGCAIADKIEGPYKKIAQTNNKLKDSRVLICPDVPKGTAHYSSPCVLWDNNEQRWLMYFHFYENEFRKGRGHQKTGLAYTHNLTMNTWTILKKKNGLPKDILPTTSARWMNSQSSYHSIHKLKSGWFLAFLRGTGGEISSKGKWIQDTTKLGFAISKNGEDWTYSPNNPIIYQTEQTQKGVFRPHYIFQENKDALLLWSQGDYYDSNQSLVVSKSSDFKTITHLGPTTLPIPVTDGAFSVWPTNTHYYIFSGKFVYKLVHKNSIKNPNSN